MTTSGTTRKHSLSDDNNDPSSIQARTTRPRLDIEPLGFGIQPPPVVNINDHQDDLHGQETDLTLYLYVHQSQSSQTPSPPPPVVLPPPQIDRQTELTMYYYVQEQPENNVVVKPPLEQVLPLIQPIEKIRSQQNVATPAPRRIRKKPTNAPRQGKSKTIQPPFIWATEHRAHVRSLKYLIDNDINTISGDMECKRCQKVYKVEYNLEEKFKEVFEYVENNKHTFYDRAPELWTHPVLPKCEFCHQENSMKPVINKKKSINWLFLFLGQMLGCCTLEQLKYFCKHTGNHRTGAKDRVLFLTYIELCKQVNSV
uniref:uncharacterized protein LOC122581584 n=1 Tax=Erigeron canadensis TaxID=72917 RepID=UPI001CB8F78A|nr:uncharacterized protein LOC122581584 [Erigeron canadensis]